MTWESITFRTALLCSLLGMCTREVLAVPNLFIDNTLPQKFMFFLSSLLGFVCSVLVVPIYQCVYFQKYTSVYPVISGSCSPCLWAFVNELWLRDCIKRVDINMIDWSTRLVLSRKQSEAFLSVSYHIGMYCCWYKCDKLPMNSKKVSPLYGSLYENWFL